MPSGQPHSKMGEGSARQGRGWLRECGGEFLFLRASGPGPDCHICLEGPAKAHDWAPLGLVIHSFNKYKLNMAAPGSGDTGFGKNSHCSCKVEDIDIR